MRLTLATLILIVVPIVAPTRAHARPRDAADDAVVAKLLVHADKLSAILEGNLEDPKKGLAAIDRYLKKQRKPMKKLIAKVIAISGELDDDARGELARAVMFDARTQRLVAAVTAFVDRHGEDPAYASRIEALLDELSAEGKPLIEALMK